MLASLLLLIITLCGCPGGAGQSPAAPAKSLVLITVDAIRPELLSIYGGQVAQPALDGLSQESAVFEDASTVCPMSRPAMVTLMTGLTPDASGVRDDLSDPVPAARRTLAEMFHEDGRATAAFVTTPFVSYASGLDRGFDLFDGPEAYQVGPGRYYPPRRPAGEAADHFAQWLSALPSEQSCFAWVHLSDLHGVADDPQVIRGAYAQKLAEIDQALSRVLEVIEASGRKDSTDVWFVGTHGVLLGEDGARGASFWLRRETLSIPLVWRAPGRAPGRDARAVDLQDVAATLARGEGQATDREGLDLSASGAARKPRTRRAWTWAPDDQLAWPPLTAVEQNGQWSVFEWEEIETSHATDGALALAAERPARPRPRALPPEIRARIEAAGFTLGRPGMPANPSLTEAESARFLADLAAVRHDLARDAAADAGPRCAALLARHPDSLAVLTHGLYLALRPDGARMAARLASRLLEDHPDRQEALHWAAHAILAAGEPLRAEPLLEGALALGPQDADVLYDLACARALAGDPQAAVGRLEEAVAAGYRNWELIDRDPDLTSIRSEPGYIALMRDRGR